MQMITSLQPGTLLAQRYYILEKIGDGGFGTVYKARDRKQFNKLVAVKEITMVALSVEEKIEATASYNREIMLLPSLQHKSLPRIYDHFTDPEHWYIVQEYIEGYTLEELLKAIPEKCLPMEEVLDIGIALCDVLAYLHSQDPPIIFRDVKPANIMLTRKGRLYLIDFGIARRYHKRQRKDTVPLGTPGYAAPEQYNKGQTRRQTDIYGLGATLQTLLTGKEPLDSQAGSAHSYHHIPGQLRMFIKQMMQHYPDERPNSMKRVQEELEQLKARYFNVDEDLKLSIGEVILYCACFASLIVSIALLFDGRWGPYIAVVLNSGIALMLYLLLLATEDSSGKLIGEAIWSSVWKRLPASLIGLVIVAGLAFSLPAEVLLKLAPILLFCCFLFYPYVIYRILKSMGKSVPYLVHVRRHVQLLQRKHRSR